TALRPRPKRFPSFIRLATESRIYFNPKEPAVMTEMELMYGFDEQGAEVPQYPETDMWAMYCPPRCRAFAEVVRQYVERAAALGLCKDADFSEMQRNAREVFIIPNPDKRLTTARKRTFAGALGVQSIFACMYQLRTDFHYDPEVENWFAETRDDG